MCKLVRRTKVTEQSLAELLLNKIKNIKPIDIIEIVGYNTDTKLKHIGIV